MATEKGQTTIELDTLYEASKMVGITKIDEQLETNLFVNSGTVNVYGSNSGTQPVSIATMTLNSENTAVGGIVPFKVIPRWIAIVQNSGTTTELVTTGVRTIDRGAIS